jgi:hypothetical protein
MEIGPKCDIPGAEDFFKRSPFRWWPFLGDTLFLIISIGICAFVMIRYRDRLPAVTEFVLAGVAMGMLLLWRTALRAHARLNQLYQTGDVRELVPRTALETAFRVAGSMIYVGLFCAYLLVAMVLMQFDRVLTRR